MRAANASVNSRSASSSAAGGQERRLHRAREAAQVAVQRDQLGGEIVEPTYDPGEIDVRGDDRQQLLAKQRKVVGEQVNILLRSIVEIEPEPGQAALQRARHRLPGWIGLSQQLGAFVDRREGGRRRLEQYQPMVLERRRAISDQRRRFVLPAVETDPERGAEL